MKKSHSLLAVLILLFSLDMRAQYVLIPDSSFSTYLDSIVPTAMVSKHFMDTTNATVLSTTYIDVENMGIKDLTGIQYFKGLITLDCGNGSPSVDSNKLHTLPPLPSSLQTLVCGNIDLQSLPPLPASLTSLNCYYNRHFSVLPSLPSGLISLEIYNDSITSLPTLPGSLGYLDCSGNWLTSLPPLPSSLQTLWANENQFLSSLPPLPNGLSILDISFDNINALPSTLPDSLIILFFTYTPVTVIPTLPAKLEYISSSFDSVHVIPTLPAGLIDLECINNPLTSPLPALPATLTTLVCDSAKLTSLPALPAGLTYLSCANNNISCFPVFPDSLYAPGSVVIFQNPFTCLPNYVSGMDATTLSFPLCSSGNINGCPAAAGVAGWVYKDIDSNCIKDSADMPLSNVPLQIYNSAGTLVGQTYSGVNGVYSFSDTAGSYKVTLDTVGMPVQIQCVHPGVDSSLTVSTLDTNINFSLTCKGGFDVGVQSVNTLGLIFPGLLDSVSIVAGDMSQWYNLNCAKGDSGTVQVTIKGPVTYVKPMAGALTPIIAGNVFTYSIADFGAINNNKAFGLVLMTDTTAVAGDTICISVAVTPSVDNNPSNNNLQYCYTVVNSHDPNMKTVYPATVPAGYDGWLTYTIHFQNTGTATARNIRISDSIDNNLDASTFQLLKYSNPNTLSVTNNFLRVVFSNINLPDSMISPSGSSGFIQYRIKPKTGLPGGTIVNNTGYIYFDYNSPVVTNTAQTLFVGGPTSVSTIVRTVTSRAFPNPSNGEFTIAVQNAEGKCTIFVYNELGQNIYMATDNFSINSSQLNINLSNQSQGVYLYRIIDANGMNLTSGKLVKQ